MICRVLLCASDVTVQLNDFLQVNKDVFDVFWREDSISVQPLVENTVQHLQRPQVCTFSVEQLWRWTHADIWGDMQYTVWKYFITFMSRSEMCETLLSHHWWLPAVWSPEAWGLSGRLGWPDSASSEGPLHTRLPGRLHSGRQLNSPHTEPPSCCRPETQGQRLLQTLR